MLKIFFISLGMIMLAELADKTQLVTIALSAKMGKPSVVFLASLLGYAVIAGISVTLGAILDKYFNPQIIRYCSGSLFLIIGGLILLGKF